MAKPRQRAVPDALPVPPRSVVLVDDHSGFRAEARALLEGDGLDVVGEAADAATALAAVGRLLPDVVLLDVRLPDGDGLDLVGRIREVAPRSIVLVTSSRAEGEYGGRVARSGAAAFVDKANLAPGVIPGILARFGRP